MSVLVQNLSTGTKVLNDGKAGAEKSQTPVDDDDTKSRIGDEYILVRKSATSSKMLTPVGLSKPNLTHSTFMKDEKSVGDPLRDMKLLKARMATRMRGQKGRGYVGRASLYLPVLTATSAANTNLAGNSDIAPANSAEYTNYSSLYDEIRVDAIHVKYMGGVLTAAATITTGGAVYPLAFGYDSTYNTTPVSLEDVLESSHSDLTALSTGVGFTGLSVTPTKFHVINVKLNHEPVANSIAGTGTVRPNWPGQWMAMSDALDTVGSLRYFIPAGGASCVTSIRMHVRLDCSFRERT